LQSTGIRSQDHLKKKRINKVIKNKDLRSRQRRDWASGMQAKDARLAHPRA